MGDSDEPSEPRRSPQSCPLDLSPHASPAPGPSARTGRDVKTPCGTEHKVPSIQQALNARWLLVVRGTLHPPLRAQKDQPEVQPPWWLWASTSPGRVAVETDTFQLPAMVPPPHSPGTRLHGAFSITRHLVLEGRGRDAWF